MLTINYHDQAYSHYKQLNSDSQRRLDKHIKRVFINQYQPVRKHQRALGRQKPPEYITINGIDYQHCRTFKHDPWSAVALYINGQHQAMCRFNRCATLWGLPMKWLSQYLAQRERKILHRLADSPFFPNELGPVQAHGRYLPHAVAFTYAPGWPLSFSRQINQTVHQQLTEALHTMHQRDMAHMDVHGSNIILTEQDQPCLIDLQTAFMIRNNRLSRSRLIKKLLSKCQQNDYYRLNKLVNRFNTNAKLDYSSPKRHKYNGPRSKLIASYRAIRLAIKALRKKSRQAKSHKQPQYLPQQPQQGKILVDEYIIHYYYHPEKVQLDIWNLSFWKPVNQLSTRY